MLPCHGRPYRCQAASIESGHGLTFIGFKGGHIQRRLLVKKAGAAPQDAARLRQKGDHRTRTWRQIRAAGNRIVIQAASEFEGQAIANQRPAGRKAWSEALNPHDRAVAPFGAGNDAIDQKPPARFSLASLNLSNT